MNAPTAALQRIGQSHSLDSITRGMLVDGTLSRPVRELHVNTLGLAVGWHGRRGDLRRLGGRA
ncbi:MAG: hypothetical protein EBS56_01110 [Planctomycetia bacterium]|nr:hypothetical protein [Planctomycetia bacterium]